MKLPPMLTSWMLASLSAVSAPSCQDEGLAARADSTTEFHTVEVESVNVFYREAGPRNGPVVLLLHGFPSSSRMYDDLIPMLAERYHVVAPDYPGFGHSDAPPPSRFDYTFEHLTQVIDGFTEQLGLKRYSLFMQDYGGPIGMRLALRHPERVEALLIQNAAAHEEGLSPLWASRRAYWLDREANVGKIRATLLSLAVARQRHVGNSPHPERYNPDTWADEYAFLTRPGESAIQEDLVYDYRTNVASYPQWQRYLRDRQPPLLVVWGKYDTTFTTAGAEAYKRDVPKAEVHILEAGHFAMDEAGDQVAGLTRSFLDSHVADAHVGTLSLR